MSKPDPTNVVLQAGGIVAQCNMFGSDGKVLMALADLDDGEFDFTEPRKRSDILVARSLSQHLKINYGTISLENTYSSLGGDIDSLLEWLQDAQKRYHRYFREEDFTAFSAAYEKGTLDPTVRELADLVWEHLETRKSDRPWG